MIQVSCLAQTKCRLAFKAINCFKREAGSGGPEHGVATLQEHVADACGVGLNKLSRKTATMKPYGCVSVGALLFELYISVLCVP